MPILSYVNKIIENAREDARQKLGSDVVGDQVISNDSLVRYCNYGIERVSGIIAEAAVGGTSIFQKVAEFPLVINQSEYQVIDNIFAEERYKNLFIYPSTTQELGKRELKEIDLSYDRSLTGFPNRYARSGGKIVLVPTPDSSTGRLKVIYDRMPDRVSLRKALVTSTTGTPITSITLNNGTFPTDVASFQDENYCCIVNPQGVVTAYNVPITSVTSTTITVPSYTLKSGEAIAAGSYVVPGEYTSTHPVLPRICEKYLTQYVVVKAFRRESSKDQDAANSELGAMETEISTTFKNITRDLMEIQMENYDPLFNL